MALNQIFQSFPKIFKQIKKKDIRFLNKNWNNFIYLSIFFLLGLIFIIATNTINKINETQNQNFNTVLNSKELTNINNYFISKINNPYTEIKYVIQNNDNIDKILKKFQINSKDVKIISNKLKQKKLTNIYAGRELKLIFKKLEDNSNTVVNLLYPLNNTTSIEIRKNQNNYIIKENILQLYKREVVIKNEIKNNLYSAAVEAGIEPNIIIEFARIYGFEVDFQRDIRKGDWFEILYERFEDDNEVIKETGKIIYASMYVNGEEINLYYF